MKISQKRIDKLEQDIDNLVNEFFKPMRGLERVKIDCHIYLHGQDKLSKVIYNKLEVDDSQIQNSGKSHWKNLSGSGKKVRFAIFRGD